MGVLNVTPDSFADGGRHVDPIRAVEHGLRMIEDGAEIIDVGGESTRPGAEPVSVEEECRRVLPVVEKLASATPVPVSVDTYKAVVAREAIARGAAIINDVSGLQYDSNLPAVAAETRAVLVLMHNRGRSQEMYRQASYADVPSEIADELRQAMSRALSAGIQRDVIILDPGLGFAKMAEHSYAALAFLDRLAELDRPILSGPSRKSFLQQALGDVPPDQRDWGTAAAVAASIIMGAHIVRVHGVKDMAAVARVADRIRHAAERHQTPELTDHPL
jgi:dihydropteroate synthase